MEGVVFTLWFTWKMVTNLDFIRVVIKVRSKFDSTKILIVVNQI